MPNNIEEDRVQAHLTSPYNFVPLNDKVLIPEWGDKISQDIPFKDGEDGTISVTFKNVTPLFVKNGMRDKKKDPNTGKISVNIKQGTPAYEDTLSAHIGNQDGKRQFFIPATSLKGMVRSVMEVMTFGAMNQYDDDYFGYRVFGKQYGGNNEYRSAMDESPYNGQEGKRRVRCGWLYANGNNEYELEDGGYPEIISRDDFDAEKIKEYEKQYYDVEHPVKCNGKILICTGEMASKKHEYLFPAQGTNKPKKIDKSIVEEFLSVYKPSSGRGQRYDKLINENFKKGNKAIPVFFIDGDQGFHIGLSRYFRMPYKHRVSDGIQQTKCYVDGSTALKDGIDMTECIFGRIDKNNSYRGRVQFENAFCNEIINEVKEIKGVLGQPKASYYPFYLKQSYSSEHQYVTYNDDKIEIAGRKFYRVHSEVCELPQGNQDENNNNKNKNENVLSTLKMLPKDKTFTLKIHLHNVRPVEIGALLSAITFHNDKLCHHNIGMAKCSGFGKLEIVENGLSVNTDGSDHSLDFYLKAFDSYMSSFTRSTEKQNWNETAQIKKLFEISSDHDKDLGYLPLNAKGCDYKYFKQKENFTLLKEPNEGNRKPESLAVEDAVASILGNIRDKRNKLRLQHFSIVLDNAMANIAGLDTSYCDSLLREYPECKESIEQLRNLIKDRNYEGKKEEINNLISSSSFSEAISLCESSLLDFPLHKEELENLKKQINEKQFDNDVSVVRNLLSQGNFEEAIKRCDSMSLHYEDRQTEIDSIMLNCKHQKFAEDISFIRVAVDSGNGDNDKALKMCNKILNEEPKLNDEELSGYKQQLSKRMAAMLPDLSSIHDVNAAGKEILKYKRTAGDDLQPVIDLVRQFLTSYKTFLVEAANSETKEAKKAQGTLKALQNYSMSIWKDNVKKWIGDAAAKQLFDELKNQ